MDTLSINSAEEIEIEDDEFLPKYLHYDPQQDSEMKQISLFYLIRKEHPMSNVNIPSFHNAIVQLLSIQNAWVMAFHTQLSFQTITYESSTPPQNVVEYRNLLHEFLRQNHHTFGLHDTPFNIFQMKLPILTHTIQWVSLDTLIHIPEDFCDLFHHLDSIEHILTHPDLPFLSGCSIIFPTPPTDLTETEFVLAMGLRWIELTHSLLFRDRIAQFICDRLNSQLIIYKRFNGIRRILDSTNMPEHTDDPVSYLPFTNGMTVYRMNCCGRDISHDTLLQIIRLSQTHKCPMCRTSLFTYR